MSVHNTGLKNRIFILLAWILVLPFLAAWPFLSAFPVFSLMGSTSFDLSTSLNIVFLLTGFWPLATIVLALWLLTKGGVRSMYRSSKGLLIGAYATVWTTLYIIASMTSR